ncbi:MAG: TolC family protein [Planctomycetota bacterium]
MLYRSSTLVRSVASLALLGGLAACRSADEWALDADRQVYELLAERRAGIATGEIEFTIQPPEDTLRQAVLAGAVGVEAPLEIDLVDCLVIGAENSRIYRNEREDLYLAALDLTLERWRYSYQEFGSLSGVLAGSGVEGESAESASFGFGLGFVKLFGIGAQVVADVGIDLARVLVTGDPWEAISSASFSITQPLLRGFGPKITLEPLTQAERNLVYAVREYERFRRAYAVDVANRYFRILSARDTLGNEQRNLERLEELRENSASLAEAGRRSEIEVDQARQDVLRANDRVIQAQQSFAAALDDFKLFLGVPISTEIDLATESGLLFAPDDPILNLSEEFAVAVALSERLDFQTTLDRLVDAERRSRVIADALRAGLDLSVDALAVSDPDELLDFDSDAAPWNLRLDLDLPINLIPERNAYRRALVTRQASERAVEEASDQIRLRLRDLRRELDSAAASLAIQEGAVQLAERRVEGADLSLQAGRSSTRDLLEAREDLVEAQNQRVRLAVDLTLAGLEYLLAIERLRILPAGIEVEREGLIAVRPDAALPTDPSESENAEFEDAEAEEQA